VKLLIDSCVWGGARHRFSDAGHDAIWAADLPKDPGDEQLLLQAIAEQRAIVTLDKDFGELSIVGGIRHFGIIRLVDISATRQPEAVVQVIELHQTELENGAIITIEPGRIRIRPGNHD